MTKPALVLVHSPLVGPLTWRPVAERMAAQGYAALCPSLSVPMAGAPPYVAAITATVAAQVRRAGVAGPVVLVGHSGAGPLLPALADELHVEVYGLVYVDSLLPQPGATWFDRAPAQLSEHLHRLASEGFLPPWHLWFDPGAVEETLPDPELRARFVAELPRVPLAYFQETAPATRWSGPGAYLRFSDGYRSDAEQARLRGWPVVEHHGSHLLMLTEPDGVASALKSTLSQLYTDPQPRLGAK